MMIKKNGPDLDAPKTLKVTLPTRLHLQLHQFKILSGQNISETVQIAVERHLADLKGEQQGPIEEFAESLA